MSTWLALALPALPLQLALRRFDAALARTLLLAITEGPIQRAQVAFCSAPARAAGIVPGMKLAAAQALAGGLISIERDGAREQAALQELACWAYQFSAHIVAYAQPEGSGLLIETGASERLFGGRAALRRRIVEGLGQLGYHGYDASAPTPAAARVLATAQEGPARQRGIDTVADLPRVLGALPLSALGWTPLVTGRLQALGLGTIADVLALPRDAFARRFGAATLIDLDRLLGRIPDPQAPFDPPQTFQARIELPADTIDVAGLLPALQRLLLLLEGFLRGHNAGATALLLRAVHSSRRDRVRTPTPVALALAAPERDPARLLRLFTERLARVSLAEAAIVLELQLERMAAWVPVNLSLLPPAPQDSAGGDALQLAELLHARLGSAGVFQLQALSDHRPERAYRIVPLSPAPGGATSSTPTPAQRPALLLARPQRLAMPAGDNPLPPCGGPLDLLAGPERIEAGWWDLGGTPQAGVHRDYFVARNRRGQTLWIYRELGAAQHWFLHGFFS